MPRGWRDLQSQVPEIRLGLECVLWGLDRGWVQRRLTGKQSCNGTRMRRGGQGGAPTPSVNVLRLVSPYENGAWILASSCAWGFCLPVMVMTYIWLFWVNKYATFFISLRFRMSLYIYHNQCKRQLKILKALLLPSGGQWWNWSLLYYYASANLFVGKGDIFRNYFEFILFI